MNNRVTRFSILMDAAMAWAIGKPLTALLPLTLAFAQF